MNNVHLLSLLKSILLSFQKVFCPMSDRSVEYQITLTSRVLVVSSPFCDSVQYVLNVFFKFNNKSYIANNSCSSCK